MNPHIIPMFGALTVGGPSNSMCVSCVYVARMRHVSAIIHTIFARIPCNAFIRKMLYFEMVRFACVCVCGALFDSERATQSDEKCTTARRIQTKPLNHARNTIIIIACVFV